MVVPLVDLEVVGVVDVPGVQGQHLAAGVEEEAGLVRVLVAESLLPGRAVLGPQQQVGGVRAPVAAEHGVAGLGHEYGGAVIRFLRRHRVVEDGDGVHLGELAGVGAGRVLFPVPAVDTAVLVGRREIVAVPVVEVAVVDVGTAAAGQAQVEGPPVHPLDLGIDEQVDARQALQGEHVRQVDVGGVAAVERPLGVAPVHVVDLVPQGAGHQVVGAVRPLLGCIPLPRVVRQGHGRQSEAAVGTHVPVVQVQLQRIARVRGLVEPDRERDQPEVDLQDDDALVDALGLLRQDRADLFELIRIVGGVLVDHVVGDGVLGHHLALGVGLSQVSATRREADVEQEIHGLPCVALVAGHQPGEGRALGVADLVALVGDVGGHGVGPLAHRAPPGGVRLPADAVPEGGQVPEVKSRPGWASACRVWVGAGEAAPDIRIPRAPARAAPGGRVLETRMIRPPFSVRRGWVCPEEGPPARDEPRGEGLGRLEGVPPQRAGDTHKNTAVPAGSQPLGRGWPFRGSLHLRGGRDGFGRS